MGKLLFPPKGQGSQQKRRWMDALGEGLYNCYILADFDPIKAKHIYMNSRVDEIAEAMVSKRAYEYVTEEEKNG